MADPKITSETKRNSRTAFVIFASVALMGSVGALLIGRDARTRPEPAAPEDAGREISKAVAGMALEAPDEDFARAVAAADRELAVLDAYAAMAEPPAEALGALREPALSSLKKAWPDLSAPARRTVAETLPAIPAGRREATLAEMLAAAAKMDEAIRQGEENIRELRRRQSTGR